MYKNESIITVLDKVSLIKEIGFKHTKLSKLNLRKGLKMTSHDWWVASKKEARNITSLNKLYRISQIVRNVLD